MGLAIGDAVGATVEFRPHGSFAPMTGRIGGGACRPAPGQWSDDTAMAWRLAESLLHNADLDPRDLMTRFERWVGEEHNSSTGRCFGIGRITLAAIGRWRATRQPFTGGPSAKTASNGSVMRPAPVALR
ncbi:ADP-ribosylglycohydrolase family protein (plasmid) [Azospirillum brasilense]|nr:ADP-ribosylglycohydrolase family protein [Azospirillum brasilense]